MAKRKVKSEFMGKGAIVQLMAVLLFLFGWVAGPLLWGVFAIAAVVLFIIGSNMSQYYYCSDCGNKIDGTHVKMCPTCKATL